MEEQPSREELIKRIAALEKALHQQEQTGGGHGVDHFDLADLTNAADGICVCHPIENPPHVLFTFWNRRMVELTGYTQEEINARGWYQSVYPDPEVQIKAKARMGMMREGINLEAEEWEITRADGEKRILRISTSLLGSGADTPSALAIMQDVTALRQSERLLRREHQALKRELESRTALLTDTDRTLKASDTRYRALFERATDAIFIENDRDEILDANPKACELLGYTREELTNMSVPDIQAPECRGEKGRVLRGELVDHQGKPFEVLDLHKDGSRIPVEVTNNRLDEKGLFLSIVRDIRGRKAAEEARREAYHILEMSPVVAFLWRNAADWPVEYVTANVARVFGYGAEDFISGRIRYSAIVHPDDLARVAGEMATFSQESNRIEFDHEPYRIVTKNGAVRWVDGHTMIRRDSTGCVTHYHGIVQDRTEHVLVLEALRRAKQQQSAILENIPDIAWLKDRDSRFIAVNEPFAQACGWAASDLVGKNDLDIWPSELAECYRSDDADVMRSRERKRVDEPLIEASGQQKVIETIKTPIFDEKGTVIGTTGIARDITERKRMEEALRRSEERYRNFVKHSIEGIWLLTFDEPISIHLDPEEQVRRIQQEGYLTECNDVLAHQYGHASSADMIGMRLMELYGDSPPERNFQSTLELVKSGYRSNDRETIERRADGERLYFLNNAIGIIEDDGLIAIWGTQRDITQQRIATNALHAEKKTSGGDLAQHRGRGDLDGLREPYHPDEPHCRNTYRLARSRSSGPAAVGGLSYCR